MNSDSRFPDPSEANEDGVLALGGEISPEWLLDAYSHGIFPWPYCDDPMIRWCSLPTRAVIELDQFHLSHRLRQTLRSGKFEVTLDQAFRDVMLGCADREEGTWITPALLEGYCTFHRAGFAHSLEVWQDGVLAGGLYGVAIGGFFAGESMFHNRTDASKVALAWTVRHLQARGFQLFDVQLSNTHLEQFHLNILSREKYLERLAHAIAQTEVTFGTQPAWKKELF